MEANEMPEKIYIHKSQYWGLMANNENITKNGIEYIRKDAFIERVINFLNYKLDDVVATRVAGTIIPHHVAKQELIEDLKKYMKG